MEMNLRDFFRLRCSEMLVMERDIWQMNNLMAQEVQDPEIRGALLQHSDPTRKQISNLEQIVDRLGGLLGPEENPVTQGMMRAHRLFLENHPSQQMLDINDALEGDKVEHLEMAAYQGLITLAQQLNEPDIVRLLEENMQGEVRMCDMLERELPHLFTGGSNQSQAA